MLHRYLSEHVVLNTEMVDSFATSITSGVRTPEVRAWIYKRTRTAFLNDTAYLTRLDTSEVPADSPGYVIQAIDRGETIYRFDTNSPSHAAISALVGRIDHIKDFLRDIEEWSARTPPRPGAGANQMEVNQIAIAKKWMTKIPRLTVEQAEQAAEEWARVAGAGTKNMTKDGVVVLYQWPNGYYAVRFTEKETCMRDGHDLQNCLRTGTYWSTVELGRQWITAIRKPNDEAVVGMRWELPEPMKLLECKGKNNDPVTGQYIPYVTELLTHFKVQGAGNHDLLAAGIHIVDGKFGTFRDLAKHSLVGGVDYYVSVSRIEGQIADRVVSCSINNQNAISTIDRGDASDAQLVLFLSNMPRRYEITGEAKRTLEANHLFQSADGQWGAFEDVAEHRHADGIDYWIIKGIIKASPNANESYRIVVDSGVLNTFTEWDRRSVANRARSILDVLKNLSVRVVGINPHLRRHLRQTNVFFDISKGFGTAQQVGKKIAENHYYVAEGNDAGTIIIEGPGRQEFVSVVNSVVSTLDDFHFTDAREVVGFVAAVNKLGFPCSPPIEDQLMHFGYVRAGGKGYGMIESVGQVVGEISNKGRSSTLMVSGSRGEGFKFLYRSEASRLPYEWFKLSRGVLGCHNHQDRGAEGLERSAAYLILRKYQVSKVDGIGISMAGGFDTRFEKIVADPDQIVTMIEAASAADQTIRKDLGGFMKSADYEDDIAEALSVNGLVRIGKDAAARLYNALNPMKMTGGPVFVKRSGSTQVFDYKVDDIYIFPADSLIQFEPVWKNHPTIYERYIKIVETMAAGIEKAISEGGQAMFHIKESANQRYHPDAYAILLPVITKGKQNNRLIRGELESRAGNVPDDAPASSRFAALNTLRKLRK